MSYVYERQDGTRIETPRRLQKVDADNYIEPETGELVRYVFLPTQLVTTDTRWAAQARKEKAVREDPFYTSLSDYKPKTEKLKEDHARKLESQGKKLKTSDIRVFT